MMAEGGSIVKLKDPDVPVPDLEEDDSDGGTAASGGGIRNCAASYIGLLKSRLPPPLLMLSDLSWRSMSTEPLPEPESVPEGPLESAAAGPAMEPLPPVATKFGPSNSTLEPWRKDTLLLRDPLKPLPLQWKNIY